MMLPPRKPGCARSAGVAAVEMAVLLPLLAFLFFVAVDFARLFYFSLTIANCARNGALYASDAYYRAESPYASLQAAALADASNFNSSANPPTVTQGSGTDASGVPYVSVTVSYNFQTITSFPGLPNTMTLQRTCCMSQAPPNPAS